ncbi:toprim domain-containing protein [bacterium]|nr:MAG: toprim domain-containing protein [bacterium]
MLQKHLSNFIDECHSNIVNDKNDEIQTAIDYLHTRQITDGSIALHRIEYCYKGSDIPDAIKSYGKEDNSTCDYSYRICGKLIVPVFSEFGESVGLATRTPSLEKGEKWWNLPKPFHKGDHLYLMDKTRQSVFKQNKIYIVEGYIDAISLYQKGIKNVGGLMGTALTIRKIGLIARYCDNVCLCLDQDENESGQKAQDVSIITLNRFAFCKELSAIEGLPMQEDPASYLMKHSLDDLLKLERSIKPAQIKDIIKRAQYRKLKQQKNIK